jgi:hypothetical protein
MDAIALVHPRWVALAADVRARAADHLAIAHSQMTADDANGINVPTCLLPSNGEDPEVVSGKKREWGGRRKLNRCACQMSKLNEVLSSKPFADKNVYKVFDDCIHGWAGARADVSRLVGGQHRRG